MIMLSINYGKVTTRTVGNKQGRRREKVMILYPPTGTLRFAGHTGGKTFGPTFPMWCRGKGPCPNCPAQS